MGDVRAEKVGGGALDVAAIGDDDFGGASEIVINAPRIGRRGRLSHQAGPGAHDGCRAQLCVRLQQVRALGNVLDVTGGDIGKSVMCRLERWLLMTSIFVVLGVRMHAFCWFTLLVCWLCMYVCVCLCVRVFVCVCLWCSIRSAHFDM